MITGSDSAKQNAKEGANMINKHIKPYDVCIVGCWEIKNYGSHVTYYALYTALRALGFRIVFVGCPGDAKYKSPGKPELYKEIPYESGEMMPQYADKIALRETNYLADCFLVGSDQLWNEHLYHFFGEFSLLDYIYSEKKKIAYATSFGTPKWTGSDMDRLEFTYYLKRFDQITVRETSGVAICKEMFNVDAGWALDPIFLCDKKAYLALAKKSDLSISGDYIAAYILDHSKEKEDCLRRVAEALHCQVYVVTDPFAPRECEWTLPIETKYTVEDWIRWFTGSKYVITDSYHGMCISVMLQKQFVAIVNTKRGSARFNDYGEILSITDRIVTSPQTIVETTILTDPIDYRRIHQTIQDEKKRCTDWLYASITAKKENTEPNAFDVLSLRLEKYIQLQKKRELDRRMKKRLIHFFALFKKTFIWRGMRTVYNRLSSKR